MNRTEAIMAMLDGKMITCDDNEEDGYLKFDDEELEPFRYINEKAAVDESMAFEGWGPETKFTIYTPPTKKVKKWRWVFRYAGRDKVDITCDHYTEEEAVNWFEDRLICPAYWTEKEFEV